MTRSGERARFKRGLGSDGATRVDLVIAGEIAAIPVALS